MNLINISTDINVHCRIMVFGVVWRIWILWKWTGVGWQILLWFWSLLNTLLRPLAHLLYSLPSFAYLILSISDIPRAIFLSFDGTMDFLLLLFFLFLQGSVVNQLKFDLEKLQEEIKAQLVSVNQLGWHCNHLNCA